ncbi:hypothetical protein C1I97_17090 [Streptomyces sp. NTH33]|nr:hypothetical protein C1I97_17090 [Streptomyces sp. NTH33]
MTAAVLAPLPALALAAYMLVLPFRPDAGIGTAITGSAAHPGSARAALWLSLVFTLLIVPATMATAWAARRGAPRLALYGGLLTLVAFGAGIAAPDSGQAAFVAAERGLDPALVTALDDAVQAHPAAGLLGVVFLLGQAIGLVLLGLALWRGGTAPAWVGVTLAVSGPAHLLGAVSSLACAVTWALTAIGYGGAAVALLRAGDDAFDLPPAGGEPGAAEERPERERTASGGRPARDARTVWRVLLAVTAPVVALIVTVGRYLLPYDMSDPLRQMFDKLVAATGYQAVAIWTGAVGPVLACSGVVAVAWVTRRRAPMLTTAAVLVAFPGYMALFAPGDYVDILTHAVGTRSGLDRETAFHLAEGLQTGFWSDVLGGVFVIGHLLGTVLLGLALWRARVVPVWLALGLAVAQPVHLASVLSGVRELDLVGWGLTAVGFAAAGRLLLRMPDDEFDLPPLRE